MPTPTSEVRTAPIARFAGHVIGGIALFVVVAFGAVVLGWTGWLLLKEIIGWAKH